MQKLLFTNVIAGGYFNLLKFLSDLFSICLCGKLLLNLNDNGNAGIYGPGPPPVRPLRMVIVFQYRPQIVLIIVVLNL